MSLKCKKEAQAVAVGEGGAGYSKVYRWPESANMDLFQRFGRTDFGATMGHWLESRVRMFGPKYTAMLMRPIERVEQVVIEDEATGNKRPWQYYHMGKTIAWSYATLWRKILAFGCGLDRIGLAGNNNSGKIAIYEDTRAEWMVSCYGIWSRGMSVVTAYANLGEEALGFALLESEACAVVCNGATVLTVVRALSAHGKQQGEGQQQQQQRAKIIHIGPVSQQAAHAASDLGILLYSWENLVRQGETMLPQENPASTASWSDKGTDTGLIMYTSGTTGNPKGVVISHSNIVAAVQGYEIRAWEVLTPPSEDDVYLGYLPLAHIIEFIGENARLVRGTKIAYGRPQTLTSLSARPHGDIEEYRPTEFTGVPRVLETIRKAVESKLPPHGTRKRQIFERAYAYRLKALRKGGDSVRRIPAFVEAVFRPARKLLGGRCRTIGAGGAPIPAYTQEFFAVVFGCEFTQGYGLTETCGAATTQNPVHLVTENVGRAMPTVELKLRSVGVHRADDADGPKGEICFRGPTVAQGYFKQQDATCAAFKEDGWFHTGDIGHLQRNGTLKIVGRVKALAKNALGEYVALEALESIYGLNDLCMPNGVCVVVNPHASFIVALVLTDEAKARAFARGARVDVSKSKFPDFLQLEVFRKAAVESLGATARKMKRKPFEFVKHARVLADEWTPQNGMLSAAMKLRRGSIEERYKQPIHEMFVAGGLRSKL